MVNSYRPEYEFYRVEIDGSAFGGLSAPQDGFIDARRQSEYAMENGYPQDYDVSLSRVRGHSRWQQIVAGMTENATPFFVGNFDYDDQSDAFAPPTMMAFTIGFDRTGVPYVENIEDVPEGERYLYGEDALRRSIARSMMVGQTRNRDVYDPQSGGTRSQHVETGPLTDDLATAEGAVTITRLDI